MIVLIPLIIFGFIAIFWLLKNMFKRENWDPSKRIPFNQGKSLPKIKSIDEILTSPSEESEILQEFGFANMRTIFPPDGFLFAYYYHDTKPQYGFLNKKLLTNTKHPVLFQNDKLVILSKNGHFPQKRIPAVVDLLSTKRFDEGKFMYTLFENVGGYVIAAVGFQYTKKYTDIQEYMDLLTTITAFAALVLNTKCNGQIILQLNRNIPDYKTDETVEIDVSSVTADVIENFTDWKKYNRNHNVCHVSVGFETPDESATIHVFEDGAWKTFQQTDNVEKYRHYAK